ncbi:MAG: hypothetical protein R6U70_08735 [Bacillota bacterium]
MRMTRVDDHSLGPGPIFFPGGNTRLGFHSFFEHVAGGEARRTYILKGGPGVGKSTFMGSIAREVNAQGHPVEYHLCASDTDSIDAVYFPGLGAAVMDGTSPHMMDPVSPGVTEMIVNLGDYWDASILRANRERIRVISEETSAHFTAAFAHLAPAGSCAEARDDLLGCHPPQHDDATLRQVRAITEFILSSRESDDPAPHLRRERHLFLSAITPQGTVTAAGRLAEAADTCWIIEDETSIISDFAISQVLSLARLHGLRCWVFHCGLDPAKLEHCFLPEIGLCILAARPGAARDSSSEVGVLQVSWPTAGQSRELSSAARDLHGAVDDALRRAVTELAAARDSHRRLEEYYTPAMDFSRVDLRRDQLIEEILTLAGEGG